MECFGLKFMLVITYNPSTGGAGRVVVCFCHVSNGLLFVSLKSGLTWFNKQ